MGFSSQPLSFHAGRINRTIERHTSLSFIKAISIACSYAGAFRMFVHLIRASLPERASSHRPFLLPVRYMIRERSHEYQPPRRFARTKAVERSRLRVEECISYRKSSCREKNAANSTHDDPSMASLQSGDKSRPNAADGGKEHARRFISRRRMRA